MLRHLLRYGNSILSRRNINLQYLKILSPTLVQKVNREGKIVTRTITNFSMFLTCSGHRRSIHSARHNVPQHSRTTKPTSRGPPIGLRSLRFLPLQLRRLPRHAFRPLATTILQRMLYLRHSRFHIWKRGSSLPKLHDLRT